MASTESAFHNVRYLRMNARRQEHLMSLGLPIRNKTVLEVGAGIGDLTSFFLDRGCTVTSIEPRPDNVDLFAARYAAARLWPEDRLHVVQADVYHLARHGEVSPHSVLFCYGLLYHLDQPVAALDEMAASCSELLILETRVSYASGESIEYVKEDAADPTNSVSGQGCLPSRRWVYRQLSKRFEHVYMPLTQPAHEQFRLNWGLPEAPHGIHRAIFVASRRQIVNSVLLQGVPDLQFSELPQLGSLVEPRQVSLIAPETIFGPMACFPDDLITDQLLEFGAHTRNELAMLMAFVDDGDFVYDIGAHIGTFAVQLSAAAGPTGRVVAVEAQRAHHAKLVQNLTARGFSARNAIHAILGKQSGPLRERLVPRNSGATFFTEAGDGDSDVPPTRGLDDIHAEIGGGRKVDVLKIDVEGMELSVLRTAQRLLSRDLPILYIEIVEEQLARYGAKAADIEHMLRSLGYRFFRNVGDRNSSNDRFVLKQLGSLADGGTFFDLLALPDGHPRMARTRHGAVGRWRAITRLVGRAR
jgi:FkbM family methyltransferase